MFVFRYIQILFLVIALLTTLGLSGQQAIITILDSKTNEPVPYAHACFEAISSGSQMHSMTNELGEVKNEIKEKTLLAITFVGYETLFDTLHVSESKTLYLIPTAFDLNEVVVTAQYTPQRVDQSIYKVKVIGVKQIEQKGATNLSNLFQNELSIRISQDGMLGSNMNIRGLGGEHVKFLIDGVPVIGRLNGDIDLGQLNLNNVDHIEMIEGPMSVVYGSNAIAGVINIITKENKNSKVSANIDTYYESVGVYNVSGGASAKKKNNTISLSGGRNFFDGYSQYDTSRSQQWKPKRQYFVDGYYIYKNKNLQFKYNSGYFNELLQAKGNLQYPYFENALDNYFTTVRFNNSIDFKSRIGQKRFLTVLGAYSLYNRVREEYYKDLTTLNESLVLQDTTTFTDLSLRIVLAKSTEASKLNYQFGLDLNGETGRGEKITDQYQEMGNYAAFFSLNYDPNGTLALQPGIRFIYNTKYSAPLIYSLNVKWSFHENMNIRASYSRGFRAPSLKELYLDFVDVNHNIKGNPDLLSENSHDVILSFGYDRETKKNLYGANIDLFYNRVYDLIKLVPIVGESNPDAAPFYTYVNIGEYTSTGFQVDLSYNIYPRFTIKAGLTETGRMYGIDEDYKVESEFLLSTDVNFSLTYSILKYGVDISTFYKYTGKYPMFAYDDELEVFYKGYEGEYNMMDISFVKSFFKRSLQVTTGIKNIFNVNSVTSTAVSGEAHSGNSSSGRLTAWGRTFFLGLTYNFNKY